MGQVESGPTARHVLMTADAMGGVWTYALALAAELARTGTRTTLATMGERPRADQRAAAAAIPGATLIESSYKVEWMDDPWADVEAAGDWLLRIEQDVHPDVIHLNGYAHARLPWRAPCLVAAHSCIFSWWRSVFGHAPPPAYGRYRREVAAGLAAAGAVVAPTRWMLRAIEREYGRVAGGVVVANGLDGDGRSAPRSKERFVFAAGRMWDRSKNLEALVAASRRLSWPVVVAGGDRGPDARVQTSDGTREGGTRWLGWLDAAAIGEWMARAAIFASPARYEPFGLGALEAALRGCALVLGDIDSLHEVWGSAAVYVPPDDVQALVEAVESLAQDDALRERLGQTALARARVFSAKAMAAGYSALYGALASRSRPETAPGEDVCV
jgi:glycosyltransferase involved in cell wall biosynthesis